MCATRKEERKRERKKKEQRIGTDGCEKRELVVCNHPNNNNDKKKRKKRYSNMYTEKHQNKKYGNFKFNFKKQLNFYLN